MVLSRGLCYAGKTHYAPKGTAPPITTASACPQRPSRVEYASNHRELAANAAKKRAGCYTTYTAGYDSAAAACGDTFLPAGFTEFAGWSDSAKERSSASSHPRI